MPTALLLLDFVNELVHDDGKLAKRGYPVFIEKHNTFDNVSALIKTARDQSMLIIHVKVGFSPDYKEVLGDSPLFSLAKKFGAFQLNSWATEFHERIDVQKDDPIVVKHRVGAFYSTRLEAILKANNINNLLLAGVATDLVVATTARDAHDRGYGVTVVADCCAAATEEDHTSVIALLEKIANIKNVSEI